MAATKTRKVQFGSLRIRSVFWFDNMHYVKDDDRFIEVSDKERVVNACQLHTRNFKYFSDGAVVEVEIG